MGNPQDKDEICGKIDYLGNLGKPRLQ